jgi:hypothetical protein
MNITSGEHNPGYSPTLFRRLITTGFDILTSAAGHPGHEGEAEAFGEAPGDQRQRRGGAGPRTFPATLDEPRREART